MDARSQDVSGVTGGNAWARAKRMVGLHLPPGAPPERVRWSLPRSLATLGALLFAAGSLLPWVAVGFRFAADAPIFYGQTLGAGGLQYFVILVSGVPSARLLEGVVWLWWAVFIAGLLLCPLLWQPLGGRLVQISSTLFTWWTALATVITTVAANAVVHELTPQPYMPLAYGRTVVQRDPQWGLAFTILGLGLSWTAAALLRHEPIPALASQAARRARLQLLGAGVVSLGAVSWALGFIALPWATVNCNALILTLNHYVSGSCGALDAGDALAYSEVGHALPLSDLNGTIPTLIYGVLAGGALLVVLACWQRTTSRGLCIWMSSWFILSLGAALFALRGVPIILRVRPPLGSDTVGTWVVGPGVAVAFVGLLLVALGLGLLWRIALRHRG